MSGGVTNAIGVTEVPPNASQVAGTTTNDNAAAGNIGQFVTATVVAASAVALTTAVAANITSISLTAGDWDVSATMDLTPAATTSITVMTVGVSATSATLAGQPGGGGVGTDPQTTITQAAQVPAAGPISLVVPPVRVSLAATTTIFLVASCAFTVSTLSAYGTIRARRMR